MEVGALLVLLGCAAARQERMGGRADNPMNVRMPKHATRGISVKSQVVKRKKGEKREKDT